MHDLHPDEPDPILAIIGAALLMACVVVGILSIEDAATEDAVATYAPGGGL